MPKRVPGRGRPHKGNRVPMMSRVSPAVADAVRDKAEELDLSYSDVIANILATHFGHPPVATPQADDQMKLTA